MRRNVELPLDIRGGVSAERKHEVATELLARVGKRVALVTGCGKDRGIGAAVALALSGQVGAVAVADVAERGAPNLNEQPQDMAASWRGLPGLVEQLTARGVKALAVHGDVSVEADCRALVDEVLAAFGRIDVLVNNAAAPQAAEFNDIEDITLAAWQRVIDVNLTGTFLVPARSCPRCGATGGAGS